MKHLYLVVFFIGLFQFTAKAQWQRLPAPTPQFEDEAGNATCIITNDTFIWVGTESSGIFKFDIQNDTDWVPANTGIQTYTIYTLVYSKGSLAATTDRGVYISTNGGNNWQPINSGLPLGQKITSFTATNGILLAATEKYGIFRSIDNGQNWVTANNGLLDNNILQVQADGNSVWALSRNAGLFKSNNQGQNWQAVSVPGNCLECSEIAIIDSAIFIAQGSLLVSRNSGGTWQADTTVKNITGIRAYNGRLLAHNAYHVYDTYDTGKVWLLDFEFNTDSTRRINTAFSRPDDIKYIATQKHGVYRGSVAAITWKPYNSGLLTANIEQIEWANGQLYTIAFGHLYSSNNRGITWVDISTSNMPKITSFLILGNKIMVSTDGGGVFVLNASQQWNAANNGLTNKQVNKLIKHDNTIFALTKDGIYRTPNDGDNWFKFTDAIDTLLFTDMLFDDNTLYVGTDLGLFKSTNGGTSFSKVDTSNIPRRHVYFIRKINGQLWLKVGIDTHVSDDGIIWPRYYYVGGITFANSVSVVQNRLYASTNSGYLLKDTAQEQWSYIKTIEGLRANVFQVNDSFLYAGTGAGLWRLPLSNVVTSTRALNPQQLKVYPNPTLSSITIDGEPAQSIEVYNLTGQKVATCNTCNTINLENTPTGIYLLKATTPSGTLVQKIVKE